MPDSDYYCLYCGTHFEKVQMDDQCPHVDSQEQGSSTGVNYVSTPLRSLPQIKQTEEMSRRAEEGTETVNWTRRESLALVSHELRTPLNVILGYSELMAEGVFGSLTDKQAETLERIKRNALTLHDLINSLLDIGRLEVRQPLTEVQEVRVSCLLDELKTETWEAYYRSGTQVSWEVEEGLAPIRTDRAKLKMVIRNLVGNAMKFTSRGSVIVQASAKGGGVEVSVTDTGIGIPQEAYSLIFEPFQQIEHSTVFRAGGVGLGLYIVKRFLDLLGGTVTVESVVGQGSTFRVWVPREQENTRT